jgi:tRNA dimethylallyltransferase
MQRHKSIIFIYGPTAVGKSDYAVALADIAPIEIVNCDVGQFYTSLSIGTAKPDWKNEKVPHHLFDVLDEPRDYTVVEYKKALLSICEEIWARGATPVVVGGSGFYIKSLFFPPAEETTPLTGTDEKFKDEETEDLWEQLVTVDPERAQALHPNDRYRIERALTLASLHRSISSLQPTYEELGVPYLLLCLSRDREDLYQRINERTEKMVQSGWIEEVSDLQKTAWAPFLKRKKLIGYDVILNALEHLEDYQTVIKTIAQKTRQYAKRQMTFWRLLEKNLAPHVEAPSMLKEVALTETQESLNAFKNRVLEFFKNVEGNNV